MKKDDFLFQPQRLPLIEPPIIKPLPLLNPLPLKEVKPITPSWDEKQRQQHYMGGGTNIIAQQRGILRK